jgi:phenylalanine-4-hydroxylase
MSRFDAAIETYPIPSLWKPRAFVSRARLARDYDLVFSKNTRYPVFITAVAKNPFSARFTLEKRLANTCQIPLENEFLFAENCTQDIKYLVYKHALDRVLSGLDAMTPTFTNQQWWAEQLSPDIEEFFTADSSYDVWGILSTFMPPLIEAHASTAHQKGIKLLGLYYQKAPVLEHVDEHLYAQSGWRLKPVSKETEPRLFFELLSNRIFPTAIHIRPLHAVFCGFEPDYWHELVGHCALLTDPAFSELYQWCGTIATKLCHESRPKVAPADLFKVLLMLLEYGIFKDSAQLRAFGGALTSSYMALQRIKRGYVRTIPFEPQLIIKRWFRDDFPVRRYKKQIELYHVSSLDDAKTIIATWAGISP